MPCDRIVLVGCLAALLASFGPADGQTATTIVDTAAVSEIQAWWEAPDRLVTRTVTRRFEPLQITALQDISRYFLLSETFTIDQVLPAEGNIGVISATLSPLRPEGIGDPLWSVEAPGNEAAFLWDERFYRVTAYGCCGAESTHTYFSLPTGREIFRGNGPLLNIRTPLGRRFVAFHNVNASVRSEEKQSDSTVADSFAVDQARFPAGVRIRRGGG